MGTDTQELTDADRHALDEIAETIAQNTQLSERQAKSFILKKVVGMRNEEVVDYMDVSSPTTVGSHVSRVKNKFQSVDEEISELEQRIEEWEKTKQLEGITTRFDTASSEQFLYEFSQIVENELVNDEDVIYLIAYVDEQGEERAQSINTHPRNIENKDVVQYKRISSVDEVFE